LATQVRRWLDPQVCEGRSPSIRIYEVSVMSEQELTPLKQTRDHQRPEFGGDVESSDPLAVGFLCGLHCLRCALE
jgi:hypothetical protein